MKAPADAIARLDAKSIAGEHECASARESIPIFRGESSLHIVG